MFLQITVEKFRCEEKEQINKLEIVVCDSSHKTDHKLVSFYCCCCFCMCVCVWGG